MCRISLGARIFRTLVVALLLALAPESRAVDCNNNAVADDADCISGFSRDCNLNRVPDECEVFPLNFGPATAFVAQGSESESLAATWLNVSGQTVRLDLNGDTFTDIVVSNENAHNLTDS